MHSNYTFYSVQTSQKTLFYIIQRYLKQDRAYRLFIDMLEGCQISA